ncbi:MAG: hypothetical protein ACFFFK_01585 [Candidatus Thorarchaeota archaeon]
MEMNEAISRLRPKASFLFKMAVVLLFPLGGNIRSSHLDWVSILLSVGIPDISLNAFPTILVGIVILLPGVIFERQIKNRPVSTRVRGRAVLACFLSWIISIILQFRGLIFNSTAIIYVTFSTPILTIAFFIVLPLIMRETMMRNLSSEHLSLNYGFIASSIRKRFRRERILSGLLWAGLIFGPFMIYYVFYWWSPTILLDSLFFRYDLFSGSYLFLDITLLQYVDIQFVGLDTLTLPVFSLLSSVRILFVRDIFRFQRSIIKKSRLVSVAILGELLPSAILTLFSLMTTPLGSGPMFFPLPILPVIGFVFIRLNKLVPIKEELWPDYGSKMWYEKDHPSYSPEPKEDTITVPMTYLLVSQVRKRLRE